MSQARFSCSRDDFVTSDVVTAMANDSACVMPFVLLVMSTFMLSSKLRPKRLKLRQNKRFGAFPPKISPLRAAKKKKQHLLRDS